MKFPGPAFLIYNEHFFQTVNVNISAIGTV